MKNLSRWFMLAMLVAALGLFGCEGDDGEDGKDFQLPQGEYVGLINCTACHAGTAIVDDYAGSAHLNQGPHTANSCATACHNPLGDNLEAASAFNVSTPSVVGCESCHGPGSSHFGVGAIPVAEPREDVCGQCHTTLPSGHIPHHPFADEITERFLTSRHAVQHARTTFCSACHSHEGGVALLSMPRLTSTQDLVAAYNENTVPSIYNLPEAAENNGVGVTTKTCATCHDSHEAGLRGEGDITAEMMGMLPADPTTTESASVVFSAEFNLCTTCHMVDLDVAPAPADGHFVLTDDGQANNGALVFNYTLSDAYTDINMQDAATGTYEMFTFQVGDRTREVFASQVFYHDGASGDGRTFADTHFGGDISTQLTEFDGSTGVVTLQGYNINAGAANACTICHDPHTGGKMLSATTSTGLDGYPDTNENKAVGYAEGLGEFHTHYQGTAAYRQTGCTPCHTGDESYSELIEGLPLDDIGNHWEVLGCRGCHDLAQANAEPGDNNAAAFAMVKQFPADYVFEFNSGVVVANDALGSSQICFECHKGRTGYLGDAGYDALAGETRGYDISYLHYAPSVAILFGDESQMVPTYNTATAYAGRFIHPGGAIDQPTAEWGCTGCHDVHDTDDNHVAENKMLTSANCTPCHSETTGAFPVSNLQARTEAFGVALLDTLVPLMESFDADTTFNADLQAVIDALVAETDPALDREILDLYIHGRTVTYPTPELAKAANVYKVFNYEDGSPHGVTHGHGGSWAHNSVFARQVQWDAILDLGGNVTGLTAPPGRTVPAP